jgi:hypothetical protein
MHHRSRKPSRRAALALLAAPLAALAFGGATAQAQIPGTQLLNAGMLQFGEKYALEAGLDSRLHLVPSRPGFIRQLWVKETRANGTIRLTLAGGPSCMAAPKTGHVLRVENCNSAGGRALWGVRNPVKGNGAGQIVNVQTGEAPLPNFFGDDTLELLSVPNADGGGAFGEYTGV